MLDLTERLPAGALCAASPDALTDDLVGAIWWHGAPQAMQIDPAHGAIARWESHGGGPTALPTAPNTGNGMLRDLAGLSGLQCRTGTHCGMVVDTALDHSTDVTLAIRYAVPPGAEARTLLTLNLADGANYVFLSEAEGRLTAQDDNGLVQAELPRGPGETPQLAILSLQSTHLALALGAARTEARAPSPPLGGPAHLFIGCRNQRPRLFKTLGGALILDVWLWPNRALLHAGAPEDRAALRAVARHHLWAAQI